MRKILLLAGVAVGGTIFSSAANAQSEDQSTEQAVAGDIVVTANRTESLLSKTPIAISAVSGDNLIQSGITNPTQLDDEVPNLAITRGNGLQITIRGVTSSDGTEKGDPSAAFMVDGIYIARQQAQEVSFFDLERVEVLRGPQGTLYGRNSTAGIVNLITAKPKFEFGARADASYGNYEAINGTAVVNVPLSSAVAVRAAVNVDRRNSHLIDGNAADNIGFGRFKDNTSIRLSALLQPMDDFSLLLVGDYSAIKGNLLNGVPASNVYGNIVTGGRATFDAPTYLHLSSSDARRSTVFQAQAGDYDNETKGVMGELNYAFGALTATYLGSYREFNRKEISVAANGFVGSDSDNHYWQTSHELRLAYKSGPVQAQFGGYYFKERSGIAFFLNNLLGPNTRFGFPQDPTIAENKSVFGQATVEVAPDLRITGGIRYSHDLKSRVGQTVLDAYSNLVSSTNRGTFLGRTVFNDNNAKRNYSKTTWRVGVDYVSPIGLLFASVSTGYKAGGFNDGCEIGTATNCDVPQGILYFAPETLTAYEAGVKLRLSPAFRINGTVFHYDYQNLQVSQVGTCGTPPTTRACGFTRSAGAAKVDGLELDAVITPASNFNVRLAFNYLDARYVKFDTPYSSTSPLTVSQAGRPLSRSPKFSWSAGVNYVIPVGEGKVVLDAQTNFKSQYDLSDYGNLAYFFQPAYTKSDASLTYHAPNDRFYVGGFINNIENTVIVTGASAGFFGSVNFADPRTLGVRAGVKF